MLDIKEYKIEEVCNLFCFSITYSYHNINYQTRNVNFISDMLGMSIVELQNELKKFNGLNPHGNICFNNRKDVENFVNTFLEPIILVNKILMFI